MPYAARRSVCSFLAYLLAMAGLFTAHAQEPAYSGGAVTWSPDGRTIAVSGRLGIRLYSAQLQSLPVQFKGAGVVAGIAWSPDSSKLASAQLDYSVRIWNAQTGMLLHRFDGHTDSVNDVSWSPDGSKIASASHDGTVQIWDAHTGQTLFVLPHDNDTVVALAWSPDGTKLASISSYLYVWNPNTGRLILKGDEMQSLGSPVSWSPDSQMIFVSGVSYSAVDGTYQGAPACAGNGGAFSAGAVSRDGSRRVLGSFNSVGASFCIEDILHSMRLTTVDLDFPSKLFAVALSPNGDRVIGLLSQGRLRLWDAASGRLLNTVPGITPTPIVNPQPLRLIPLCSPDPNTRRVWQIDNPNAFEVAVIWKVNNADTNQFASTRNQWGQAIIPAAVGAVPGIRVFSTNTEPGTNTIQVFSPPDTLQATKDSNPTECAPSTPALTSTPVRLP